MQNRILKTLGIATSGEVPSSAFTEKATPNEEINKENT